MRSVVIGLAVLAGGLVSGCGFGFTPYTAAVGPQAVLHIVRPTSEPTGFQAPPHWFFAYANPDCALTEEGGFLGSISWDVGNELEQPVTAGQRLYVRSIAREIYFGGSTMMSNYCTNMSSFVPEAGRRYRFQQEVTYPGCRVALVEEETSLRPPSFQIEAVEPRCAEFNAYNDGETAAS